MKKIIVFLFAIVSTIANAQSLIGQWASLQPIEEQPAYLIMQFEEKDSVGLGLLFEMEQEGNKIKITVTCDGTFEQEEEELSLNFIDSTVKGSCDIDLSEDLKSQLTDEINSQIDELKKQLVDEIKKKFVQILPMLKALEIIDLTEKELKVTTGSFEMTFTKIVNEE